MSRHWPPSILVHHHIVPAPPFVCCHVPPTAAAAKPAATPQSPLPIVSLPPPVCPLVLTILTPLPPRLSGQKRGKLFSSLRHRQCCAPAMYCIAWWLSQTAACNSLAPLFLKSYACCCSLSTTLSSNTHHHQRAAYNSREPSAADLSIPGAVALDKVAVRPPTIALRGTQVRHIVSDCCDLFQKQSLLHCQGSSKHAT